MASAWSKFTTHISLHGGLMVGPLGDGAVFTKMFRKLIPEDEAKLGVYVPKHPKSVEEIAKAAGISPEQAAPMLKHMAQKGTIFEREAGGKFFYNITPFIPGFYEYVMTDPETRKDPEMAELFRDVNHILPGKLLQFVSGQEGGLLKVTPVMKEINAQRKAYTFEDLMTFVDATDSYSIAPCACRLSAKMVGKGCEHPIEDTCAQFGDTAEYYIRTGRGRRVTKGEMIDLLKKTEEAGLVHTAFSVEGKDYTSFICNCCGCSCSGLRYTNIFDGNPFSRSNFRAEINEDNCVACGECVKICPVNAVTLGTNFADNVEEQLPEYKQAAENFMTSNDDNWDYIRNRHMTGKKGTSPCKVACPAHISVQGYLQKAAEGDYLGALKVIKKDNPFPAVCGRICSHPCEQACTRGAVDNPIAIDAVKMFIADRENEEETRFVPEKLEDRDEKVAIIGSGPAGLSCAYYLAIDGFQVTVFEKQNVLGGMLTLGIPSFRLEKDVINSEIQVLRDLGVAFKTGVEVGKDISIEGLRKQGYQAFYLAIGAQKGSSLGLAGEDLPNVMNGVDFLRKINLKETLNISGKVIVVGGGNVAIDVARSAVREGADSVDLYCLESAEEMPAALDEQYEAKQEGVVFHNGWGPMEILQDGGKATGITFKRCTSVKDSTGRFNPTYDESTTETAEASVILLAIGQRIDWGGLRDGEDLKLGCANRVDVHKVTYMTSEDDVFAGGDMVTGPRFAIDAIAMGKQGSISISRQLRGLNLIDNRPMNYLQIDTDEVKVGTYDAIPRQKARTVDYKAAAQTFDDLRAGLTEEQILEETKRCLHCGRSVVDTAKCLGCGVCTLRCDFDAIHLTRVSDSTPSINFPAWYGRIGKYAVKRIGKMAVTEAKKLTTR